MRVEAAEVISVGLVVMAARVLVVGGSGFVFAVEGDWHLSREVPIHQALPFCARYWTASFPHSVTAHVARPWARVTAWSLSSAASHRVVLHILVP